MPGTLTHVRVSRRIMQHLVPKVALVACTLIGCAPNMLRADCSLTNTDRTPLNDLGPGIYRGFSGGLYPNGKNNRPTAHNAAGLEIATNQIKPLDAAGNTNSTTGKVVMISIGMSNTTQEYAIGD